MRWRYPLFFLILGTILGIGFGLVQRFGLHDYFLPGHCSEECYRNDYETSVDWTLDQLQWACEQEGWNISKETFERLAKTAPAWPRGRNAFRSLRIRFGRGDAGVAETFAAHTRRFVRMAGQNMAFQPEDLLGPDYAKRVRLHNGNSTQKPVVEWIIIDLGAADRTLKYYSLHAPNSLADEGLVLAWMFPERLPNDFLRGWVLSGYEFDQPTESDGRRWHSVLAIYAKTTGDVRLISEPLD